MKILFTSEEVIEVCNGRYYSMNLGQHLTKYSYMGDIVCVCYCKEVESTKLPEVDMNSAEFIFTKKMNSLKALCNKKGNKKIISELIGHKKIDCLVCHVPSDNSSLAIKYAKKHKMPYLTVVVGCSWDALWNYDWRGKCLAIQAFLSLRRTVKNATHALYVTEHFLQNRYPTKGKTEHASNVCIEKVPDNVLMKRLEKISGYTDKSRLDIATVAAVNVRYKGQEYVIRAIAKLNKQMGYNYHYYLVGGGDNTFLKRVVSECCAEDFVHFMGALPHKDVTETLDKMDLYIQPSKQEGLPRALIEAMSRALPAVGTRVAGIPELLSDDFLVKKGSVDEIVRVLSTNMDKESMMKQAEANFKKASEYTLDIINARRQKFFDTFINDNSLRN